MSKRKLVLEEHEGSVLVGIMQEGCDPVVKTVEGNLEDALQTIPQLLTEAQEKWQASPRMPTYTPPVEAKVEAAAAAAEAAKPTEELPLLQAEEKAEPPVEEKAEVPTEPGVAEPEAEPIAAAAVAPELKEIPTEVAVTGEEKIAMSRMAEQGAWEYYLKDGRGPFPTVQAAMDAMGLDKATRPQHNRWDRLSTQLKDAIQRRPKA